MRTLNTAEQATIYLTDCTLATVSAMAMKAKRSKFEYERQISIAQRGIDYIIGAKVSLYPQQTNYIHTTRVQDIINMYGGSVTDWARKYEIK